MKRFACISLVLVLSFSTISVARGATISESQKQLDSINGSISDKKDKLDDINKNREEIQNQIDSLDSETSTLSGKITSINVELNTVSDRLTKAQNDLEQAEKKMEEQEIMFRNRVKAMYTSGNVTYLEVMLGSESFSDMVSRLEWIEAIIEYDKNLIEEIKEEKAVIEEKKVELAEQKNKIQTLKAEADTKYIELEQKTSAKQTLMASLEKDKAYYEKMIAAEEQQAARIKEMIRQMQSQNSGSITPTETGTRSITGGKSYTITSAYGWRVHPVLGYQKFHSGIDIAVPSGTPLYAVRGGTITYAGWMSGYGNVVMINHGDIISLYAHNSSLAVAVGQKVSGGKLISYSGSTGMSTGPHLHFEIRLSSTGDTINPTSYYVR
ncbi:MAG: murein hydrolase activator EnvC [Clostridiaceae bacterium]